MRGGRLRELEGAERLLELRANAVERRVRTRGDHRPDELERQSDRARLERRQPRRAAERVAEELLVDVHLVAVQLRVDRVAAAAEVDEVQQREVLLELLGRDREPLDELLRRDRRLALVTAGGEQIREQRLQDAEALRRDRAGGPLGGRVGLALDDLGGRRRRRALVRGARGARALDDETAQLRRLERDRAAVLAEDPAGEQSDDAYSVTKTSPSTRLRSPP